MNYRHAYHAGNFADVLKHAVLALVIEHLKRKEAPFRVIDTHAGAGRYRLASAEAAKTGEWREGIGRLIGPDARPLPDQAARRLRPYLDAVAAENNEGAALATYPGSPSLALRLMRPQDRLIANELNEEERKGLERALGRDARAKVMALDGWVALKSLLPPRERRGLVLIDPPFEEERELERLTRGLSDALERFATGTYIAWYPIKDVKPVARFRKAVAAMSLPKPPLCAELFVRRPSDPDLLNGCGLLIVNGPYTLADDLGVLLPELSRRLARAPGATYRLGAPENMGRDLHKPSVPGKRRMRMTR
jgi:23S rRNA (adenine2030-N6)-methyltransferase